MIILEDLPKIEGGTDRQKMFAESIRLDFISFVETYMANRLADAELVVAVRLDYQWWIGNRRIYWTSAKNMIAGSKRAVTRAGSIEAAIEAQRIAVEKKKNAWLNSRPLGGILDGIHRENKGNLS
jgi:hypothetical protein